MLTAITRGVSAAMGNCELTFAPRADIDIGLAEQQHEQYKSVLTSIGCEIVTLPAEAELADSVFIEDTVIVLGEVAVLCRPGAKSRRPEVTAVADVLQHYRKLESIQPPGTLDGGDLLQVGKIIYAGLSTRSNQSGVEQLQNITADYGYTVKTVATTKCLHLKSAVSEVAPGSLLINSGWVSRAEFGDCDLIEVYQQEADAANALLVGGKVIYPTSFPHTTKILESRGIEVINVDLSELQKAEGAVTCCSVVLRSP